ncbi:MAG: flagellar FliJ family protein [Rhodospirillaceae bacterium]
MRGLPSLIRLHQWKVDVQRRKVTELEILSEQLEDQVARLQSDIDREGRTSGEDVVSSAAFSAFLKGALQRREKLRGSIGELRQQISDAKDDLADAYRELKSYEIAQANRERRDARKQGLRDRIKMDEVGLAMYRRRTS